MVRDSRGMEYIELTRLNDHMNVDMNDGEETNLTSLWGKELKMIFRYISFDSFLFCFLLIFIFSVPRNSKKKEILEVEK